MGILTQQQGTKYVISSDSSAAEAPTKRRRGKPFATYEVWTGETWSAAGADATIFESLDDADRYVKENYARLSGKR